jgi:hypothetical protein
MGGDTRYAIVHRRPGNTKAGKFGPNTRPKSNIPFKREPALEELPNPKKAVKESGVRVRESQITAAITSDAVKACTEIAEVVSEYDRNRETHEGKIRGILDNLSAAQINNLRYKLFAPHYDGHMDSHASAIALLLSQIPPIERLAFPREVGSLIQSDLLELSCGTGTVIDILSRNIPSTRLAKMSITANDLSEDMKDVARMMVDDCLKGLRKTDNG